MFRRTLIAALPLVLLLAVPILLKPRETVAPKTGADKLVMVTPHNEPVRAEFAAAFEKFYRERYGREVQVDYRTVGGTSDIVRYLADQYEAAFRHAWEKAGNDWTPEIAAGFSNPRPSPSAEVRRARKMFLESNTTIGIDIFWGGGVYDHNKQAVRGFAVDGGVRQRHPEYFKPEIIPERFGGDVFYDRQGRFYGACLASFGICYNPDRVAAMTPNTPPDTWRSLGEGRFFDTLAVADPTKSGSANKCYEAILQQCMQEAVARLGNEPAGVAAGWIEGFSLIKRIVANARLVSDGASQVPREVSSGNAAAGMAIDTYGLSEQQWSEEILGKPSIRYLPPRGGSAISADPVQILRGAPNRQAAEAFVDFLLSAEGQKLWDYRAGTPGGPVKYALRRPPIRRDLYTPEHLQYFSDPDYDPYKAGASFVYHAAWTGPAFNLIRVLVKCTALDPQIELREAWRAILQAGGPEKVPEAMREFNAFPVPYADIRRAAAGLAVSEKNPLIAVVRLQRSWSESAIRHYRRAAELARQGR